MEAIFDWREHTGSNDEKFYKTSLWKGQHTLIGLNCLEPGQTQAAHAHDGSDKFYFVLEGAGTFAIGDVQQRAECGMIVAAAAGVKHGVTNDGKERLTLLVAISPPPTKK
ncbi:MAG TPA: cupin domain-containing protein [Pyrinomonadaceae bacterium]|nr:cupin domain-containing protein [Pyrinomonadaceae bacterium]